MRERLAAKYGTDDLRAVISGCPEQDTVLMGQFGFRFIMKNPFTGEETGAAPYGGSRRRFMPKTFAKSMFWA